MEHPKILLVEDNEGDILLIKDAFEELDYDVELQVVRDGAQAIQYLFKENTYFGVKSPEVILLDINLPKLNGLEVLKRIKENESTKSIPVIMLTTSSSQNDVGTAYKNYANCYIVKPDDAIGLVNTIKSIDDFWFKLSELPTQ